MTNSQFATVAAIEIYTIVERYKSVYRVRCDVNYALLRNRDESGTIWFLTGVRLRLLSQADTEGQCVQLFFAINCLCNCFGQNR